MNGRPDPVAMRMAARHLVGAAEDVEHEARIVRGSVHRVEGRWAGSAALGHAGAVGAYVRALAAFARALRTVAQEASTTATQLDRELADLARLEARCTAMPGAGPSYLDAQVEEAWTRIRLHQQRFAHALGGIQPGGDEPRRMRCGPVRPPDLGIVIPPRMRTGPVRPIAAPWPGGRGEVQVIAVQRPVPAS